MCLFIFWTTFRLPLRLLVTTPLDTGIVALAHAPCVMSYAVVPCPSKRKLRRSVPPLQALLSIGKVPTVNTNLFGCRNEKQICSEEEEAESRHEHSARVQGSACQVNSNHESRTSRVGAIAFLLNHLHHIVGSRNRHRRRYCLEGGVQVVGKTLKQSNAWEQGHPSCTYVAASVLGSLLNISALRPSIVLAEQASCVDPCLELCEPHPEEKSAFSASTRGGESGSIMERR